MPTAFLSESELFWVATLRRRLDYAMDSLEHPYSCLAETAAEFGIGGAAILEGPLPPDPVAVPADIRWSIDGVPVTDPNQIADFREWIKRGMNQARIELSADQDPEPLLIRLDRMAQCVIHQRLCGHAMSTPRSLFSMNAEGEVSLLCRVRPHPRGLFLAVLRTVGPYMDLPIYEHMAIASECPASGEVLSAWTPSLQGINDQHGEWEPGECLRLLGEQFIGDLESPTAACGSDLVAAYHTFWDLLKPPEKPAGESSSPPSSPAASDAGPPIDPEERVTVDNLLEQLPVLVRVAQAEAAPDAGLRGDRLLFKVAEVTLAGAVEFCRSHGIDHAASVLAGIQHEAARWGEDVAGLPERLRRPVAISHEKSRRVRAYAENIRNAQKLIYGELRYRATLESMTGLTDDALPGAAAQHRNIQDVLRHAVDQLNSGGPAYVVLSSLSPAVEPVIREVASRNLKELRAYKVADIIRQLRDVANERQDEDLKLLSHVGQAANTLRNRVQHQAAGAFDEHHAHFLFHALSLMLREL